MERNILVVFLMLKKLENSGALPRLTTMTNTSTRVATGVIADKTATLKMKVQVR